ncbi:MAG: sulfatase-like hydrolase/transferase [Pirellulales bacterium]|nr:sulfatase-like hydrolase/transferase [Pirellulales bacterium]
MQRHWLITMLIATVLVFLAKTAISAVPRLPEHPNVLIITTDQQRVDAARAVGNPWAKTPNIDSLAAKGVYFTRSYCAYPLCSPSRSSLHTGRTPHEIGVDRNSVPIDPAVLLSGQVFRDAGFDTGYAGKWHMPHPYPNDGIAGFEVLNKTSRQGKLAHDVDEATKDAAIEFLRRKRDKPFFLVASFINPHDICLLAGETSPLFDEVWKKYGPPAGAELPPLPPNFDKTAGETQAIAQRLHPDWDATHWRKYRYAYFRMLEDVDRQVGQVIDALRQNGQEDHTVVIFTSDHGEGLGSRHWTGKMAFFDEEAAVPLIVSWKGVTSAGRIDREHLVSTLDVLPTVCDYVGVQPPPRIRGASLRGVIEKPELPGHEFVVSEMARGGQGDPGRSFMLRTKKYKYLSFPAAGANPIELLFDLDTDPNETKDLAGESPLARELERHRRLLAEWKTTTEEAKYPVTAAPNARRRAKQ